MILLKPKYFMPSYKFSTEMSHRTTSISPGKFCSVGERDR